MGVEVVILGLLPFIWQEATLFCDLNNYFKFDHNIFLLDASTDINQFVGGGNYPKSLYVFESSHGNVTGLERLQEIMSKNNLMTVIPESSAFGKN